MNSDVLLQNHFPKIRCNQSLNVGAACLSLWTGIKSHFFLLVGASFICTVMPALISVVVRLGLEQLSNLDLLSQLSTGDRVKLISVLAQSSLGVGQWLVATLLYSFMQGGFWQICLKLVDGRKPQFRDLFSMTSAFWMFFAANLIFSLSVGAGCLLLLVPGLILLVRLGFYAATMADQRVGAIAGLKLSWELTKGQMLKIACLIMVMALLYVGVKLSLYIGCRLIEIAVYGAAYYMSLIWEYITDPRKLTGNVVEFFDVFTGFLASQFLTVMIGLIYAHAYRQLSNLRKEEVRS